MKTFTQFLAEASRPSRAKPADFKKISYSSFETLVPSSNDYQDDSIDGKGVTGAFKNGNCIGVWYRKAQVGSHNPNFKGDLMSFTEQDPHWPYD